MNTGLPNPPGPKRRTALVILIAWSCIATLGLVAVLLFYLDETGIITLRSSGRPTQHYYPADLEKMDLPQWRATNAIPLAPDQAVLAAMRYLQPKHPTVSSWDVYTINLRKTPGSQIWTYSIDLMDRQSGNFEWESVNVLMDGNIWLPSAERRQ